MNAQRSHFTLRGWHVLAMMLSFFGLVIAVNIYFSIVALSTFPGEDVTHPYIQGLEYNRELAEHRAQRAVGWRATAGLDRLGSGAALVVTLHKRDGSPLDGAQIEGALRWPADARRDHALTFEHVGPGAYRARIGELAEGAWDLRARATQGHDALDFEADLQWPTAR